MRKLTNRATTRMLVPAGAIVVLALMVLGTGVASACHPSSPSPPYTVLTTIPRVDAIAANSTMVFAQGEVNCSQIWAITATGEVYVYATVPVPDSACDQGALALGPNTTCASSGGGGAPLPASPVRDDGLSEGSGTGHGHGHHGCHPQGPGNVLYDVVAGGLYEISNGGSDVTLLATLSTVSQYAVEFGLTYDQVGTFQHDLIVTSDPGGKVWLYNCTEGTLTLLAAVHSRIGGPAVAPMSFGPYGGDVVIAAKTLGEVLAVAPDGTVTAVTNWSEANAVTFPSIGHHGDSCGTVCSFGPQHFVLFVANYSSGAVEAFPAKDLRGFGGMGFVAGGLNQGIAGFTSGGNTQLFASETQRLSDITSVVCFFPAHGCGHHGGGPCGGKGTWGH
ncbi:MAG TPA: hypothetical protein VMH38_06610 [Thermoplasmata archaeon]|nr:hypothetical protein [Thermoplasmata archaeon]